MPRNPENPHRLMHASDESMQCCCGYRVVGDAPAIVLFAMEEHFEAMDAFVRIREGDTVYVNDEEHPRNGEHGIADVVGMHGAFVRFPDSGDAILIALDHLSKLPPAMGHGAERDTSPTPSAVVQEHSTVVLRSDNRPRRGMIREAE